jgi:hypothetical protein
MTQQPSVTDVAEDHAAGPSWLATGCYRLDARSR